MVSRQSLCNPKARGSFPLSNQILHTKPKFHALLLLASSRQELSKLFSSSKNALRAVNFRTLRPGVLTGDVGSTAFKSTFFRPTSEVSKVSCSTERNSTERNLVVFDFFVGDRHCISRSKAASRRCNAAFSSSSCSTRVFLVSEGSSCTSEISREWRESRCSSYFVFPLKAALTFGLDVHCFDPSEER